MDRKQNVVKLIETVKSLMESDTKLRNSQVKALHQFTDNPEKPERGIFNLATGVGKTRIMSMLALAYLQNNPNSQIVIALPSIELFEQEINAFQDYKDFQDKQREQFDLPVLNMPQKLDMGVFNQFDKNTTSRVIFTSYQSMENLTKCMDTDKVGLVLLDEAHHVVSDRRTNALNSFSNAIHYGMTATPWYSPERNAQRVLGDIIAKINIVDAIQDEEPALAEYKNVLMVSDLSVDLSKVEKTNTGDYDEKSYCNAILQAMRGNSVNSGNVENWKEAHHYIAQEVARFYRDYVDENVGALNGKKCLINCRSQEEARIQAQELNKLFGRMVARVHTSDECDSQTIQDFKGGNLPVVCQVGKLTEGFDMSNLDITINYPTASFVREAQGAARCLRLPEAGAMITPRKMGLIVDIAFKHPDYDNIVDAIRQNGQVLFQDVVGTPFVKHTNKALQLEEIEKTELEKLRERYFRKEYKRLGFTIVSDVHELQRLIREADELSDKRYIPPIRPGMRSAKDLTKEFGYYLKISDWFEECVNNKEKNVFFLDTDVKHERPFELVQKVRSSGQVCFALDEHPEALRTFIQMHPELQITTIRPGMRSITDFKKEFGLGDLKVSNWFKECIQNSVKFYLDSDINHEQPRDLIQFIKNKSGRPCLALDEHPEALRTFVQMHPEIQNALENKNIPSIRPGMRGREAIAKEFHVDKLKIATWFEECVNDKKRNIFFLDSDVKQEHPLELIQKVKSRHIHLALDEHPEALRTFMQMHPEIAIKTMRSGMRISADFGTDYLKVNEWFKECINDKEKNTFFLDSDIKKKNPFELVQNVKGKNGLFCLALDEHPEALRIFMQMHPEIQNALENKKISPIRPGMRGIESAAKEFHVDISKVSTWFEECINDKRKNIFFLDSDVKQEHPLELIQRVRNTNIISLALDEHPEALRTFMQMHPEIQIPPIRLGMRSVKDFMKEFHIGYTKVSSWFKECGDDKKKNVFFLDSDEKHENPLKLIQKVRSSGHVCFALDEHPEALMTFKKWLKDTYGVELKERNTSPIMKPNLKVASVLCNPRIFTAHKDLMSEM